MDSKRDERLKRLVGKRVGLAPDDPLIERFTKYVVATATGDLGTSFRTREPVTKMLAVRIWPSLKLVLAAMTFAILVGVIATLIVVRHRENLARLLDGSEPRIGTPTK